MSTSLMALCWPLQMPPTPKAVLISLADNANDQGYCWPSIARISERTCFSKRAVIDAIAWLEQSGILAADRTNGRHTTYVINPTDFAQPVQETHRCGKSTGAPAASEPVHLPHQPVHLPHQPVREMHTNRKEPSLTVSKSNRQKDARGVHVTLPEWLSEDLWSDWVEHRKSIRKPMTQRAAELAIGQLTDLREQGFTAKAVIENAIVSGWVGLYAPKVQQQRGGQPNGQGGNRQQQLEERNRAAADEWLNSRNSHA
jgi:hypothetical protein